MAFKSRLLARIFILMPAAFKAVVMGVPIFPPSFKVDSHLDYASEESQYINCKICHNIIT